jgi:hypothetical protein
LKSHDAILTMTQAANSCASSRSGESITYEVLESHPPMLRKLRIADKNLPYAERGPIKFSRSRKGVV